MPNEAEQARKLQADAASRYTAIDNDPRRSDDAKRDDKIRVYSKLRRDLASLHAQQDSNRATRGRDLERKLFGLRPGATANDMMAYTDREAAADRIEDVREATRRMIRARARGDELLVQAIAARAVDAGWEDLVDAYVTDIRPEAAADLAELRRLRTPDLKADFANEGNFVVIAPPGLRVDQWDLQVRANELDAEDGISSADAAAQVGRNALEELLGGLFEELDSKNAVLNSVPPSDSSSGDDTYYEAS